MEHRDKLGIKPGRFPGFTARLPGQTTKIICKQLNFASLMLLKKITSSPPLESHPYILKAWLSFSPSPAVTWAINSLSFGVQKGKAAEKGAKGAGLAELGLGTLCSLPCWEGSSSTHRLWDLGALVPPPAGFLVSPAQPGPCLTPSESGLTRSSQPAARAALGGVQSTNLQGKCLSLISVMAVDGGRGWEMIIFYFKAAGALKQFTLMHFCGCLYMYVCLRCIQSPLSSFLALSPASPSPI